jgi:hypothetical protein
MPHAWHFLLAAAVLAGLPAQNTAVYSGRSA